MKTKDRFLHWSCWSRSAGFLPVLWLFLNTSAPAATLPQPQAKSFSVAPHGELQLTIPKGWKDRLKPSPGNLPPTIELYSGANEFVVLLTALHPGTDRPIWANLKSSVEALSRPAVAQSVEKKAEVKSLQGEHTQGYYYSVTDPAPRPGEYTYMTQGLSRVGELLVQFTILSNDATEKTRDAALEVIRTAGHIAKGTEAIGTSTSLEIPISGQGWKVRVFDPGLGTLQQRTESGNFMCRSAAGNGFNLSVFVEKPGSTGNQHEDVFKFYWSKSKQNPLIEEDSIKVERTPKFVKVSYRTASMPNVNYYFAFKGRWVDVHISKLPFAKEDEPLFTRFDELLAYGD